MKILRVKKFPLFDIFLGDGWLNWTRILMRETPRVIAGEQLPQSRLNEITTKLSEQNVNPKTNTNT